MKNPLKLINDFGKRVENLELRETRDNPHRIYAKNSLMTLIFGIAFGASIFEKLGVFSLIILGVAIVHILCTYLNFKEVFK